MTVKILAKQADFQNKNDNAWDVLWATKHPISAVPLRAEPISIINRDSVRAILPNDIDNRKISVTIKVCKGHGVLYTINFF